MIKIILIIFAIGNLTLKNEPTPYMHKVFYDAGVPQELWEDFLSVAACESDLQPDASGDHGLAQGLFQIHWGIWGKWGLDNGHIKSDNALDPINNTRLAYAIGEHYSRPRNNDRWNQWSAKPGWQVCKDKADNLLY